MRPRVDLAKRLGAELAFVCVVDPAENIAPGSGISAAELMALAQRDAKGLLAGFRQRAPQGLSPLELIAVGKPASEIVKVAREWPADVIVMGSHRRVPDLCEERRARDARVEVAPESGIVTVKHRAQSARRRRDRVPPDVSDLETVHVPGKRA